jgi:hypothetical protein
LGVTATGKYQVPVQAENLILRISSLNHFKVVSKVTGHGLEKWSIFDSKHWQGIFFLIFKISRPAPKLNKPPFQCVHGLLLWGKSA